MNAADLPFSAPSRSGPVVPVEPAAASVWQPEQPWLSNSCAPSCGEPPVDAAVVVVDDSAVEVDAPLPASSSAAAVLPACSLVVTLWLSSATRWAFSSAALRQANVMV